MSASAGAADAASGGSADATSTGMAAAATAGESRCLLLGGDGKEFEVALSVAKRSNLIREMIEENEDDSSGEVVAIPLPNVDGKTLAKVLAFCERQASDPLPDFEKPLTSARLADFVPEWYCTFMDIPRAETFALITAANYMDIGPLLDLACAKIAAEMKGMSEMERTEAFGSPVDLTPAQEKLVRDFNKWEEGPRSSSSSSTSSSSD